MRPKKKGVKRIKIKIIDRHGNEYKYVQLSTTKFGVGFNDYCKLMKLDKDSTLFIYEATRISDDKTPDDLNMKWGNIIDVIVTK